MLGAVIPEFGQIKAAEVDDPKVLDPPLVLLCVSNTSSTWPRIRATGLFCINVLAAQQQQLSTKFARSRSDRLVDFKGRIPQHHPLERRSNTSSIRARSAHPATGDQPTSMGNREIR
jgi:hypothetical protein